MKEIIIDPGKMTEEEKQALIEVSKHRRAGKPARSASAKYRLRISRSKVSNKSRSAVRPRVRDIPEVDRALDVILLELKKGNAVLVTSIKSTVTPNEAADLLGVSRPYLVKLLDEGQISYWMVGSHRRLNTDEVLAYREKMRQNARKGMQFLMDQAQELKMGY